MQSLTVDIVAFEKAGEHAPHRPRPSASRADWRRRLASPPRTALASRSRCCEYRSVYAINPPSAGSEAVRRGRGSLERL